MAGDTLQISSGVINVQGDALRGDTLQLADASAVLNVAGGAHFTLTGQGDATVNLAADSAWIDGFNLAYNSTLIVNGGPHAVFINDTASTFSFGGGTTFNTDVAGTGSISGTEAGMYFGDSVGAGQTITDDALIVVEKPYEYHAFTHLNAFAELDLVGLAGVDSYTLKNDLLSLYSGNRDIYNTRITTVQADGFPFAVGQTATGVTVFASYIDFNSTVPAPLPVHHFA